MVTNTAAGIALTLSIPLTVGGTLTLTDGVVQATAPNRLYLSNTSAAALVAGAGNTDFATSFLTGTFRRALGSGVATYVFPLGTATPALRRVNVLISNLTGVGYLDGTFGTKPGTYTAVNDAGIWTLTPDAAPTGGSYGMQLSIAGFSGLLDNQFAPLRRPDASGNGAAWQAPAGSAIPALGQPGRTLASGYAERTGLTSFSQFGGYLRPRRDRRGGYPAAPAERGEAVVRPAEPVELILNSASTHSASAALQSA